MDEDGCRLPSVVVLSMGQGAVLFNSIFSSICNLGRAAVDFSARITDWCCHKDAYHGMDVSTDNDDAVCTKKRAERMLTLVMWRRFVEG